MINRVYATITAVDTPTTGRYEARTIFGTIINGVSLRGLNHKFTLGQRVAIFQVGGAFGSFDAMGTYESYLQVPGSHIPAVIQDAPAKVALKYLADLAGNRKLLYSIGTVVGTGSTSLIVTGDKIGSSKTISCSGVSAAAFIVGDQVLISHKNRAPVVIGWWNTQQTWQPSVYALYLSFVFGTLRPALYRYFINETGGIEVQSQLEFSPTKPESTTLSHTPQYSTADALDYLYSLAVYTNGFTETERHYLRWHKDMSQVESIPVGEYPPDPITAYSTTVDNKFWWLASLGGYCLQSDTETGDKYTVFPGEADNYGIWLPAKGQVYTAL